MEQSPQTSGPPDPHPNEDIFELADKETAQRRHIPNGTQAGEPIEDQIPLDDRDIIDKSWFEDLDDTF